MRSEQTVECGKEQTKEEEVTWGCDSMIKVDSMTKASASLVISEVEMERSFSIITYMKGKIEF